MAKYENDASDDVSDCCGEPITTEDLCLYCGEHCNIKEWDEMDETPYEMNAHLRSIGY